MGATYERLGYPEETYICSDGSLMAIVPADYYELRFAESRLDRSEVDARARHSRRLVVGNEEQVENAIQEELNDWNRSDESRLMLAPSVVPEKKPDAWIVLPEKFDTEIEDSDLIEMGLTYLGAEEAIPYAGSYNFRGNEYRLFLHSARDARELQRHERKKSAKVARYFFIAPAVVATQPVEPIVVGGQGFVLVQFDADMATSSPPTAVLEITGCLRPIDQGQWQFASTLTLGVEATAKARRIPRRAALRRIEGASI